MIHEIKKKIKRTLGIEKYSFERRVQTHYFGNRIKNIEEGNRLIYELLTSEHPAMVARFGSVELSCVINYLRNKGKNWWDFVIRDIENNAGFFPSTPKSLTRFSEAFLKYTESIDILGVWFNEGEDIVYKNYCQRAELIELKTIEPYYASSPWTKALEDKKVLVVHPFAESIENQYKHREFLFYNKEVLPSFDLQAIKAVQSIAQQDTSFKSWFDAYDFMCEEITKRDFDIAIIGAGAYGLPLASFVKQQGKKAVHMGGATQVLFGIKGKRWDEIPFFRSMYNKYWFRPLSKETPNSAFKVEGWLLLVKKRISNMERNYYEAYYDLERKHWWFQVRLKIIENELKKLDLYETINVSSRSILNIGVATGKTSQMLEQFGKVTSLEYDSTCANFTRNKLGIEVIEGSILNLPFSDNRFDWVCAFDVIEHIEDDKLAVSEMLRVSRSNVCITVPAFQSLWSKHDEINHHYRRYTLPMMRLLFKENKVMRATYFNTFLFLPICLFRYINKLLPQKWFRKGAGSDLELFDYDSWSNRVAKKLFSMEIKPLYKGKVFIYGVSLLFFCNKN